MKHPQFNYKLPKPEKVFIDKYIEIDIKNISLDEFIRALPKDVRFSDVVFRAEAEIEHGYYNETTASIEGISACYNISGENPNYEKEKSEYDAERKRYNKEMIIYNEWVKQEEIKKAEEILKKYGKK
jgi:hypothetical protein